jgi:hypothetical protein
MVLFHTVLATFRSMSSSLLLPLYYIIAKNCDIPVCNVAKPTTAAFSRLGPNFVIDLYWNALYLYSSQGTEFYTHKRGSEVTVVCWHLYSSMLDAWKQTILN